MKHIVVSRNGSLWLFSDPSGQLDLETLETKYYVLGRPLIRHRYCLLPLSVYLSDYTPLRIWLYARIRRIITRRREPNER